MSRRTRRMAGLFAALLVYALFPVEWLGTHWAPLGRVFDGVLASAWLHAAGHIAIFFALGTLARAVFPPLRARLLPYLALMTLIALAQEGFQLLWKGRPVAFDDYRDLATDLLGFGAAWLVGQRNRHTRILEKIRPPLDAREVGTSRTIKPNE